MKLHGAMILLLWTNLPAAGVLASEPTNAAVAALQNQVKATWNLEADAKRKALMSPAELAWESTLENLLGSFYLPLYKKDKAKGIVTAWDFVKDDPALPRVLVIGDSVSRGYTLPLRKAMAGVANLHRAPENCGPTSKGVKNLDVYLAGEKWDLITFNFSIHDRATAMAEYLSRLKEIATRLKATGARVLWVSGTPLGDKPEDDPVFMVPKNEAAANLMAELQVPVLDLYSFVKPRQAELQKARDVHFSDDGYEAMGAFIGENLKKLLPSK